LATFLLFILVKKRINPIPKYNSNQIEDIHRMIITLHPHALKKTKLESSKKKIPEFWR